ncbi:unnamed protein product [Thelazia callipaeda]|uniref:Methionine--tRNA ligase, mitochondrial n=1 Tax=Thelazia callipaeda TaxID=103827 RepID=A0A0N5CZF5_THECL|nr:unnamed protein product [Thelazia callipaeda]
MISSFKKFFAIKGLEVASKKLKHFITTPIFYTNGRPHIGHLYTLLLADVLNRWELLKKGGDNESLFITGTDEHGLKIQQAANAVGCSPQKYCDDISNEFRNLLREFDVQPNDFIRTTEARHKNVVQFVWHELEKRGQLKRQYYEGWYSTTDECFYASDEVERLNGQTLMVSKMTGTVVEWAQEENYIFPISKYKNAIKIWLSDNALSSDIIRPKVYLTEALRQADAIEDNLSLSRDRKRVTWGIAVPNDENQTIYVWLDALMNYLTGSGIFSNSRERNWPPTCQIIGKDIMKFHIVIWPALLLAMDLPLPKRIFVHGHWLIDGIKMSKSFGNVVDPFIASKLLGKEGLRYFLLRQGTPQSDANFMVRKAVDVINADLVNNMGNLLQRSLFAKFNLTQIYPAFHRDVFQDDLFELGEPLVDSINCLPDLYKEQCDKLMTYKALELLMDVMKQTNRFFQHYEPWNQINDKKVSSLLYVCCEALRVCGILMQPILPHYSHQLLNRLGIQIRERNLSNANFFADSKYSGLPLGEYEGPIMKRILWKSADSSQKLNSFHNANYIINTFVIYLFFRFLKKMSGDEILLRKRVKKTPHECTVILIDVGANMNLEQNGISAMQLAKDSVEWIITRKVYLILCYILMQLVELTVTMKNLFKIFSESSDQFTLVLFGSEETQNPLTLDQHIFFCEEEMQQAKIDWLRFIDKEIKPSKSVRGNYMAALIVGLEYMRTQLESCPECNIIVRNILLITNLNGCDENPDKEYIEAAINGIKALEINFSIIGPSLEQPTRKLKKEIFVNEYSAVREKGMLQLTTPEIESAVHAITAIVQQTDGTIYSFAEALPVLQRFVPRKLNLRGQRFYLELGTDVKLPLQLYKKIQIADFKLAMAKYAPSSDTQLRRKTVYEKLGGSEEVADAVQSVVTGAEDHTNYLSQSRASKSLGKEDIVKGYKFGTTIIPYNDEDQKEFGWKSENRCLKLIQFAKRTEILEHYLMDGGVFYCIPPAHDKDACIALSALVNAMIIEKSVALARFVYNAASHPRIMALFPRKSKKGVDMMVGIYLPFYEDFRGLDFPALEDFRSKPTHDHLNAMNAFMKAMDLTKAFYEVETGQFREVLRPRDVPNPMLQYVCKAMKHRALYPNTPLPIVDDKLLGDLLQPNVSLLKRAEEALSYLKASFPLLESPKKKRHIKEEDEILPSPEK